MVEGTVDDKGWVDTGRSRWSLFTLFREVVGREVVAVFAVKFVTPGGVMVNPKTE